MHVVVVVVEFCLCFEHVIFYSRFLSCLCFARENENVIRESVYFQFLFIITL